MKDTKIQWAHHTFNPWIGCTKVSAGCKNCYAEAFDKRFKKQRWGVGAKRERTSNKNWKEPLKWDALAKEKGEIHRVFCASLADVFDTEVPQEWFNDLIELVRKTPNLLWMFLTKRPENIEQRFDTIRSTNANEEGDPIPSNIWFGVTVENQEQTKRLEIMRSVMDWLSPNSEKFFVSAEPILDFIDLGRHEADVDCVIVGGESGPNARAFNEAWARNLIACLGPKVFLKQMGANPFRSGGFPMQLDDKKGADISEWPLFLINHQESFRWLANRGSP